MIERALFQLGFLAVEGGEDGGGVFGGRPLEEHALGIRRDQRAFATQAKAADAADFDLLVEPGLAHDTVEGVLDLLAM